MASISADTLKTLPVGRLGIIPLKSCQAMGQKVNDYIVKWRKEQITKKKIP